MPKAWVGHMQKICRCQTTPSSTTRRPTYILSYWSVVLVIGFTNGRKSSHTKCKHMPSIDRASIDLLGVDFPSLVGLVLIAFGHKLGPPQGPFVLRKVGWMLNALVYMLGMSHIHLNKNEHVKYAKANLNIQACIKVNISNVKDILGRLTSKHHQTLDIASKHPYKPF